MMVEIEKAIDVVADKSDSLILDMTSNAAGSFMSRVSKTIGGKRVDFSKGGGYRRRCHVAALSYNMRGPQWHSYFYRRKYGRSPGTPMRKLNERIKQKTTTRRSKRKLQFQDASTSSKGPKFSCEADKDYGDSAQKPDVSPALYALEEEEFEESLCVTPEKQQEVQISTKDQAESKLWHEERRITSTKLYDVCRKHKAGFKFQSVVNSILYPKPINTPDLEYGRSHEKTAGEAYKKSHCNIRVQECGLFISLNMPLRNTRQTPQW